jgi:hypothetical protein
MLLFFRGVRYMEVIDGLFATFPMEPYSQSDWAAFKQWMRFLQAAGNMLNAGLHNMTDAGTIHLSALLPDAHKMADILGGFLEPSAVAEMVTASVNPHLVSRLQGACFISFLSVGGEGVGGGAKVGV